jgi:hypothetical protein
MFTMTLRSPQSAICMRIVRSFVAILCSLLIAPGNALYATPAVQEAPPQDAPAKLSAQELDSLVAPIALYPDDLLSQALVASTYPLEIIQMQQWLAANKNLKGKELTDAAMKQKWDPSVQAMVMFPDMVKQLGDNIKWATDLGNAVLAQQSDVMDAVQRMRGKAKDNGNLKNSEQQKVETKVVENKQVIVIQPSNPEVVYVPSYNPTVVYGPPPYPYPPIVYPPPPPPGYYAAGMAISFGVGMMMGAMWSGGGWGWHCGWSGGNNNININRNNTFVNNSNRNFQGGNRVNGGNTWQHNPQHRGGAPYADRTTANRYGGTARGDSLQNRQANARQNVGGGNRQAGAAGGGLDRSNANRGASAGTMDRSGANRGAAAGNADRGAGADRGSSPSAGTMDRSGANRASSGAGGGDKIGNRSVPSSSGSRSSGAFDGGSAGSARASSARGSSSFGGGGGGRGGGGRRR